MNLIKAPIYTYPELKTYYKEERIRSKELNSIIYSTCISAENSSSCYFIIGCSSIGCLYIWNASEVLLQSNSVQNKELQKPAVFKIKVSNEALYYVELVNELLLVSGIGGIFCYNWNEIQNCLISSSLALSSLLKPFINLYPHPNALERTKIEINHLCHDASSSSNIIYGASGDLFGCYQWDLTTNQLLHTFPSSHYLHACELYDNNQLVTAGENGILSFWDTRSYKLIRNIVLKERISSSKITKDDTCAFFDAATATTSHYWISSFDISKDWIAFGGGYTNSKQQQQQQQQGFLSLYNVRADSITSTHLTNEYIQAVKYNNDRIVTCGNESYVSYWNRFCSSRMERAFCSINGNVLKSGYGIFLHPNQDYMLISGRSSPFLGVSCFLDSSHPSFLFQI